MTHIAEPYYLFKKPRNFFLVIHPKSVHSSRVIYIFHCDPISSADARCVFDIACAAWKLFHCVHAVLFLNQRYRIPPTLNISSSEVCFSDRFVPVQARFSSALSAFRYRGTEYAARCISVFSFRTCEGISVRSISCHYNVVEFWINLYNTAWANSKKKPITCFQEISISNASNITFIMPFWIISSTVY